MFSAVGHSVALIMLLVSPRWFPVPDTSAGTMDGIEVHLFSASVSGDTAHALTSTTEVPEEVFPSAVAPEAPKPKPKPAIEKAAVPSVLSTPEPIQHTKAETPGDPPSAPAKASPIQIAKVGSVPAPKPEPPKAFVKKSVDTLLDSIRAGMNVPAPMAPVVPFPETPKLAHLSDFQGVPSSTVGSLEISERVQKTVKGALKNVAVPAPTQRLVPIQEAKKLAKLPDIPEMFPELSDSSSAKERVHTAIDEVLKTVTVPAPLAAVVPVPERRKLVVLPDISPNVLFPESVDVARTKEQVKTAITRALEEVEIPLPMEDSEPLDVAALPPSASLASSVHSELRMIREQNNVVAEEQVSARQQGANSDSSGSPSTMQQAAHWEQAFAKYSGRVKMVINRNWHWQGDNRLELSVVLSFRIYPDGRATRVAIAQTSGNQIFDRAAIRAVRQLKRLPRFPVNIQREFLDVEMYFSKVRAS